MKEEIEAIMSIQPPSPVDGEILCRTPSCKSAGKLRRTDLACWWCGSTDFEVVSEELKVWMRIPKPPEKVMTWDAGPPPGGQPVLTAMQLMQQRPTLTLDDIMHKLRDIHQTIAEQEARTYHHMYPAPAKCPPPRVASYEEMMRMMEKEHLKMIDDSLKRTFLGFDMGEEEEVK